MKFRQPQVAFVLVGALTIGMAGGCASEVAQVEPPQQPPPVEEEEQPPVSNEPLPFELRRDAPVLLHFWVRHQRLAQLLDVPTSDAVFDELRANRLLLGDYDHAAGIAPDLQWSSAKMALWARVLRPVCAHPNMRARHPFYALDLTREAWGREPTVDEVQGIKADLDATGLVGDARDQVACIAILSSLEHVAQ